MSIMAGMPAFEGGTTEEEFRSVAVTANLRGVTVWAGVMLLGSAFEIASKLYGPAYWTATLWEMAGYAAAILSALVLMRTRSTKASALFPPLALSALLLLMQHTLATSAWEGQLENCYPYVLLGIPVVCLFPARTIGLFLVATTISYLVFVIALPPLPLEVKLIDARDAVLACAAATIASQLIYTPRQREWHQRALVEARGRELEEHYARLDELMAVTAHDLRSPLLGLRNLIRLTLDRAREDPSQVLASLRLADRSLRSILALIGGLLDAHEAERGAVGVAVQWTLRPMLEDLIARARPSAEASGTAITLDMPEAPITMVTDFNAISRIIDNLLVNAVRFTPRGGCVTVAVDQIGKSVTIAVRDQGPGVASDEVDRIFDKFYRGELREGERQHGSGLGLFIARQTAHNLGGSVVYRPNEPQGAIFAFTMTVETGEPSG